MTGILLEGVTGAGKTQTLRALMQHPQFSTLLGSGRVFDEGETFGEFMAEIQGQEIADGRHFRRLERVLTLLEQRAASIQGRAGFVLERFHLSYYALFPGRRRSICSQAPRSHAEVAVVDSRDRYRLEIVERVRRPDRRRLESSDVTPAGCHSASY